MTIQYLVVFVLLVLLAAVADSSALWMSSMPNAVHMTILLAVAVLVAAYAGLILSERGGDEREVIHRSIAGRAGFLAGVITLTLALLVQGLHHHVDPWIPFALAVMIVAKVASRAWTSRRG